MRTLLANAYLTIELDEVAAIVHYTRLPPMFETVTEAQRIYDELGLLLDRLDGRPWNLLMDLRQGPGRNDAAFEQLLARYRAMLFDRFPRRAAVVKTAAGALQLWRLERPHAGQEMRVFSDEASALAFLTRP